MKIGMVNVVSIRLNYLEIRFLIQCSVQFLISPMCSCPPIMSWHSNKDLVILIHSQTCNALDLRIMSHLNVYYL